MSVPSAAGHCLAATAAALPPELRQQMGLSSSEIPAEEGMVESVSQAVSRVLGTGEDTLVVVDDAPGGAGAGGLHGLFQSMLSQMLSL